MLGDEEKTSDLGAPLLGNVQRTLVGGEGISGIEGSTATADVQLVIHSEETSADVKTRRQELLAVSKEIAGGTTSFAVRSLIIALAFAGNGLIMSSLGPDAAAASSITATLQGAGIGFISGIQSSVGTVLGRAMGAEDRKSVGNIIKSSWVLAFLTAIPVAGVFFASRQLLPLILDSGTANAAADYLQAFALAVPAEVLTFNNGVIPHRVEHNSWAALLNTCTYRIPSLALAYYLGNILGWGPKGLGYAAAIVGWSNVIGFQPWFSRQAYKEFGLYSGKIEGLAGYLKHYFKEGFPLGAQRFIEWSSLAMPAMIIGAWSPQSLLASQASIFMLTLAGQWTQGASTATMLIASETGAAKKKALSEYIETLQPEHLRKAVALKRKNGQNFWISSIVGLTASFLLALLFYLFRSSIINLYAPNGTSDSVLSTALLLLLVNIAAILPDTMRITSSGILRGWGDLSTPTIANFILIGAGIALGAVIGSMMDDSAMAVFVARILSLMGAAAFNCYRYNQHMNSDQRELDAADFMKRLFPSDMAGGSSVTVSAGIERAFPPETLFGLTLQDVPKDGHCFFHAVEVCLAGLGEDDHRETYIDIRKKVAEHIREHMSLYERFLREDERGHFVRQIEEGGWGDHIIALVVARVYGVNLVIIQAGRENPYIVHEPSARGTFYLAYDHSALHYQALRGVPDVALRQRIMDTPLDDYVPALSGQRRDAVAPKLWMTTLSSDRKMPSLQGGVN